MDKAKIYFHNIDALKGLAILLMVMAHVLAWSYREPNFLNYSLCELEQNQFCAAFMFRLIYSFHMPLLFFVSGFLFYKAIDYNRVTIVKIFTKRIQRILIPYVFTGVFVYILRGYFGYWFLQILFIVNCIVLLENLILQSLKKGIYVELAMHFFVYFVLTIFSRFIGHYDLPREFMNLGGVNSYYLAFVFGCMIRHYQLLEVKLLNMKTNLFCLALFVLLFILDNSSYKLSIFGILMPILAIGFLYGTFKSSDYSWLEIVGKNSLEIYILHIFFVMPFKEVGDYILGQNDFPFSLTLQICYSLVISVISIRLSIKIADFLKQNKCLSKLLFGI